MKCCIELLFDERSQQKINELRKLLNDSGVHDEAVPTNHISIVDFETNDEELVKKISNEFANTHSSFEITLSSAGTFMTSENVLFFSPTINETLLKYNEDICNMLYFNNISVTKYYTKNNWVPHCILAIRLNDEELKEGLAILKDNNILPLKVFCDRIDILDYSNKPNYNQMAVFNLKK